MKTILLILTIWLLALTASSTTWYVSKAGSDGNSGASWSQAWLTLTNVNDSTEFSYGDTAIIGAGRWREELYLISGTETDKTCYMDSAWSMGTEDSRVAWIYGSDSLHTWTQIDATNVYICSYTPTVMDDQVGIWQGDSILFRQTDSADVNVAGESWYGNNHIVAYVYGGDDPDNYQIEIGQRNCVLQCRGDAGVLKPGQDNVTLIGLGFKYSRNHQFTGCATGQWELGWDSCLISHCYFACNTGGGAGNASLIYAGRAGIPNDNNTDPRYSELLDGFDYNRYNACSLGMNYTFQAALPQQQKSYNGGGMNFYGQRYSVIDSNVFWGYLKDDGALKFKCMYDADDGAGAYDTIRFNTFNCATDALLQMWSGTHHFAIYGNTFQNTENTSGIYMEYSALGVAGAGYHKIYNNTFYDCRMVSENGQAGYDFPYRENEFKYNVMYESTGLTTVYFDSTKFWIDVDSNLYYAASGTNEWLSDSATYTWSQWQTAGMDAHGIENTDPAFNSAATGDFSRPSASGEMNRTYGGQTWIVFGAVQNAGTTTKTLKIKGGYLKGVKIE